MKKRKGSAPRVYVIPPENPEEFRRIYEMHQANFRVSVLVCAVLAAAVVGLFLFAIFGLK